jgi:hypothetical protein
MGGTFDGGSKTGPHPACLDIVSDADVIEFQVDVDVRTFIQWMVGN